MIEVKAKIQEINAPLKAHIGEMNQRIHTDVSDHLIYAISPTVKIDDEPEEVRITATDKNGTTTGTVTKGIRNYEKLDNLPKISGKVVKGSRALDYYGIDTLTNMELEALLA